MPIRVLELFCGTKSIGKHCARFPFMFHVTSLDVDSKCNPTHVADILEWDYKALYPPGHFDMVWASPPCTHYSILRTTGGPRDMDGANRIVEKTIEILQYFQPKAWFMENPGSGYLKSQSFMDGIPFIDVHYCKYGYPYRKWTRIWTNVQGVQGKQCTMDCDALVYNEATGCWRHRSTFGGIFPGVPLRQRYSIPPLLVAELIDAACKTILYMSSDLLYRARDIIMIGGRRLPIRIRSVSVENPEDVHEYSSVSEAAKAIADQCPQNNVRAALTRCIAKNEQLAGRKWVAISTPSSAPEGDVVVVTQPIVKKSPYQPPQKSSAPCNQPAVNEQVRMAELELQKQQAILKAKQVELLLLYIQNLKIHDDPSLHILIKQYLL